LARSSVRLAGLLFAVLLAVLGAGCGGDGDDVLKVGYFPNITHGPAILSKEEGILAREMGDEPVEWVRFLSGPEAITALLAGSIDAAYTGPGPVITAASRAPGEIVVLAGAADAGATLVAAKGSRVRSVRGLDGASVAIPTFGNTQDLTLRVELEAVGLRAQTHGGTVRIVPVENQELEAALENGVVDAAMAPEPWGSRLMEAGVANMVLDADEILGGDYPTTMLIASADLVRDRPDVARALIRANAKAVALARKDPDLVARRFNEIVVAGGGKPVKDEVLRSAVARTIPTTEVSASAISRLIAAAEDAGYLRDKVRVTDILP
jgi:NitT/TauT family transport system substrate-binding protein